VWAEYFVAPAAALIPVPDAIADEAAAQLVSMPFSALSLLEYLDVEPGQWIAQNTANGAVGRLVAQLAAARGVHVLGLVRRAEGVEELAAAGIEGVVATDQDGWRERASRSRVALPSSRASTRSAARRAVTCCRSSPRTARSSSSARWRRRRWSFVR
jgi:NADPH:quinone reductase-like Zn-dependent oxidoreductase